MTDLTVHIRDEEVQQRLAARAAAHGHSAEEEVREIVRQTLGCRKAPAEPCDPNDPYGPPRPGESVADVFRRFFWSWGGAELDAPERSQEMTSSPDDTDLSTDLRYMALHLSLGRATGFVGMVNPVTPYPTADDDPVGARQPAASTTVKVSLPLRDWRNRWMEVYVTRTPAEDYIIHDAEETLGDLEQGGLDMSPTGPVNRLLSHTVITDGQPQTSEGALQRRAPADATASEVMDQVWELGRTIIMLHTLRKLATAGIMADAMASPTTLND